MVKPQGMRWVVGGGVMKKETYPHTPDHMHEYRKKGVARGIAQVLGKKSGCAKCFGVFLEGEVGAAPSLCFCNDMIRWGLKRGCRQGI